MTADLQLALEAAELADQLTMSVFRRPALDVDLKEDLSPVTEADRGAEAAIRQLLTHERPGDAVLGEEMGTTGEGSRCWYIDPVDGTANFVRGIPAWATLIALEVDGTMQLGVVSAPALGRRWWAERGQGAFAAAPGQAGQPIHVSSVAELAQSSVSSGSVGKFADPRRVADLVARCHRDRGFGDFWSHMLVAEGACEVGLDPVVSVWDVAPIQVIVEEAGGMFTDLSGARRLDGGNAVSSNGLVHDLVLSSLAGAAPGARA